MCGAHIFFFMESKVAVDFSYLLMPDKQGVKGHSKINYRTSVTPTYPSGHWLCQGHWPQTLIEVSRQILHFVLLH